jgi:hypothetical protein
LGWKGKVELLPYWLRITPIILTRRSSPMASHPQSYQRVRKKLMAQLKLYRFKRFFLASLIRAGDVATKDFTSQRRLYFASCFSVAERDLPRLKDELREVLHRFVDGAEVANSDSVATIVTAML